MKIPKTISAIYWIDQNKQTLENKAARLLLTYRNTYATNYWYIGYYGSEAPSFERGQEGKN